jgi:hypothetical protein
MSSYLPLESELLVPHPRDRDSGIVVRHFGLDGNGGANFQCIGDEVGLTRERVRQIVSESDPGSYLKQSGIPALQRLIAVVTASLPAPAAALEARLKQEGITRDVFRLEGIIEIAALLQLPAPFRLTSLADRRYVVGCDYPRFQEIVSRARRKVRRYGMAVLADCLPGAAKQKHTERDFAVLEEILLAHRDFKWLDQASGWFWLSGVRMNRAVSRIRKMFAVANTLGIADIRAGLSRMGNPPAPDAILLEFCRQMPELSVDGETISARAGMRSAEVLNPTEKTIVHLLSEHNGCLSNAELICRTRALGMKRASFYQCVTQSPVVSRYKRGHYRLVGSRQLSGATA